MDITLSATIRYVNTYTGKYVGKMKIDVKNNIQEYKSKPIVSNRNITIFYDKIIPVGRNIVGNAMS